jgi:hypothetical protein
MAYKKNALEYYGLDVQNYVRGKTFYSAKDGADVDPRQLFNNITYNISEIFSKIVVRTLNQKEPKITIDLSSKNFSDRLIIVTKYYAIFGRCYCIQLSDEIIQFGIISIAIQTKVNIYVYFGYPGQFMHVKHNKCFPINYVDSNLGIVIFNEQTTALLNQFSPRS